MTPFSVPEILRIPSENRTLLRNFLAIWPLQRRIIAIPICDFGALQVLACRCTHLLACSTRAALFRLPFLIILASSWDMYKCAPTLPLVSACLRGNMLTSIMVFLMWGFLGFHGSARRERHVSQRSSTKRPICGPSLFVFLQIILSVPAILCQVGTSVPGWVGSVQPWIAAMTTAFIGALQGVLGASVIPALAQKLTSRKYTYITVANLFVGCVLPATVIVVLDATCFANWTSMWWPCRGNPDAFRQAAAVPMGGASNEFIDILRSREICNPAYARRQTSISRCIEHTLLRMQSMWLSKLIVLGLLIPAGRLVVENWYIDSAEVAGKLAILLAYAIIASGHLP